MMTIPGLHDMLQRGFSTSIRPWVTIRISLILLFLLLVVAVLALTAGPYDFDLAMIFRVFNPFIDSTDIQTARGILFDIRLPRIIMAASVGAGLSVAGVIFQVLLRNVLADPYILGVSGGASVGALLSIVTGASALSLLVQPLAAFIGALSVIAIVALLGLRKGAASNTLLLSGVMIGAFLSALILGLVSTMDRSIRNALFWLIGYLGNTTATEVAIVAPIVLILGIVAVLLSGRMNLLALGFSTAEQLGLEIRRVQAGMFILASLLTAVVVSFAGAIGFVGLIVPHACRLFTGPDHRLLVPASLLSGAAFMITSDLIARTILHPVELPVGAVTAALGSPVFLFLLLKSRP
jgi:iron complex transport system permease protein